jgi:hypothetical protein
MKRIFFILFLIFYGTKIFCQVENVSCIIIIDGQLPINTISGWITVHDSIFSNEKIPFVYSPGTIMIEDSKMNDIRNLPDTDHIIINIAHIEFYKHQQRKINYYKAELEVNIFCDINNQFVFNITNFNKKKGIYYFDYFFLPVVKKLDLKKEYGNRKKAYKKIKKVLPDLYSDY